MLTALGVIIICLSVVGYILFACSHDRHTDLPEPRTKEDWCLSFVPLYYFWYLLKLKLESFDD